MAAESTTETAPSAVAMLASTEATAIPVQAGKRQLPEAKKWKVLFPVFMDSRKTIADGRRIPKARGVEGPTPQEVAEACARLGLPTALEVNKAFPRDPTQYGRIRVCLKDATGALIVANIPNRRALMLGVAELIPKLPSRNAGKDSASGGKKKKKGGK